MTERPVQTGAEIAIRAKSADIRRVSIDHRDWLSPVVTGLLLAAVIPLSRAARLELASPVHLLRFVPALAAQGISVAVLLFSLQRPSVVISRLRQNDPRRFWFLVPVVVLLVFLYGPVNGALFSVGAVGIAEYLSGFKGRWIVPVASILVPPAYFLLSFGIVYNYNDVIASFRFYAAYDPAFLRIDRWILFGGSVSGISHWVLRHSNHHVFSFLEIIYLGTFVQVGAGIVLCGLTSGMRRAFRLVATISIAYYITLVFFFFFPSHGPYVLCPDHFATFPSTLRSYAIQRVFLENVQALWQHHDVLTSTGGYYISFPCMHITQPLIILWFLRQSKRIVTVLVIYDLLLIPAILLLEWHYAVDLIGGVLVAAVVLYFLGDTERHSAQSANSVTRKV